MCSGPKNGTKVFLPPPCVCAEVHAHTGTHTWSTVHQEKLKASQLFLPLCPCSLLCSSDQGSNWPTSFSSAMITRNKIYHSNTRGFQFSHNYRKEVKYDRADHEQMGLSPTKKVKMRRCRATAFPAVEGLDWLASWPDNQYAVLTSATTSSLGVSISELLLVQTKQAIKVNSQCSELIHSITL